MKEDKSNGVLAVAVAVVVAVAVAVVVAKVVSNWLRRLRCDLV